MFEVLLAGKVLDLGHESLSRDTREGVAQLCRDVVVEIDLLKVLRSTLDLFDGVDVACAIAAAILLVHLCVCHLCRVEVIGRKERKKEKAICIKTAMTGALWALSPPCHLVC